MRDERSIAAQPLLTESAAAGNCPACAEMRCHTGEEWKRHPLHKHGYDGVAWTDAEAKRLHDLEAERAAVASAAKRAGA